VCGCAASFQRSAFSDQLLRREQHVAPDARTVLVAILTASRTTLQQINNLHWQAA